jgi:radical SAM superfamily enzyme YgiQ (UPF0313 family)
MARIVFVSPSSAKSLKIGGFTSDAMKAVKGKRCSFIAPLAPAIFARLTPSHHTFIFIDEEIEDFYHEELNADLVAITAMSVQANRSYQIAGDFRRLGVPVVIGGIHASVMTEDVMPHCDSVMIGEGENTWPAMLEDFERGELKKVYNAKDFPPVTEMVRPDYSIYKHDQYFTFPLQATKGCPYNCDFCSIRYASGHKYRMKSIEDVVADIQEAETFNDMSLAGAERKSYFFVDDNLYVNREYTKKLFGAMAELDVVWDGQGTINTASDPEVVELMAKSGCRSFSFGLESISPEALAEVNKPKVNTDADYATAIKTLSDKGIVPGAFFIVGFDNDDITVFEDTLAFMKETHLLQTIVSMLTPYPGTELHRRMEEENRIFTKSWEHYNSWRCVFIPKKMTVDDLQAGFYWLGLQMSRLEYIKEAVEVFWENPAWADKPRLKIFERLVLLGMAAVKMRGSRAFKGYRKFLYWAALHPKARDFRFIVWLVIRTELAGISSYLTHYNPAEEKRKRLAQLAKKS